MGSDFKLDTKIEKLEIPYHIRTRNALLIGKLVLLLLYWNKNVPKETCLLEKIHEHFYSESMV